MMMAENGSTDGSENAGIPFWLPPTIALLSCVAMGLTSFGDAILFHCLWAAAGAMGLYPASPHTLSFAVFYIIIMPLSCLPAMLYASRADLKRCFGWGTLCASSTVTMLPVGAALLLGGDVSVLRVAAGIFFLVFSVSQLLVAAAPPSWAVACSAMRRGGWARFEHGSATLSVPASSGGTEDDGAASASSTSKLPNDDVDIMRNGDAVFNAASSDTTSSSSGSGAGVALTPASLPSPAQPVAREPPPFNRDAVGLSSLDLLGRSQPVVVAGSGLPTSMSWRSFIAAHFPPIAPGTVTVRATAVALWVTGFASGLLGGLLGTSGPPYMVTYSMLQLDKDTIRGITVSASVYTTALKLIVLIVTPGSVARVADAPLYAAITVASWAGVAVGAALRPLVDSTAMLRILYCLVYLTSGIMLGVLDNARVAVAYASGTLALACVLIALRCRRRSAL